MGSDSEARGTPTQDATQSEVVAPRGQATPRVDTAASGVFPASPATRAEEPEPRYELRGEVARGGLGRILRAYDRQLDREVALKELLRSSHRAEERFLREALITAKLQHPSIVPVYDAGLKPGGEPYYAMKLVSGRPLSQAISDAGSLDGRLALLPQVIAVCDAVAYAHSRGVIHRDLKPQNVIVGEFGETVVIDWGLAKDLGAVAAGSDAGEEPAATARGPLFDETAEGAVMGTPAYMPPEQALGRPVDERADVYSLGAILYHLLAGEPPYAGGPSKEILARVVGGPPAPLSAPGIPADLRALVEKAMAREPEARYRAAGELAGELRRFGAGQLVGVYRYSAAERLLRFARRNLAAVSIAAAALLLLAAVGGASLARVLAEQAATRPR